MCNHGGMKALEAVEVVIEAAPCDIERFGQALGLQATVATFAELLQGDVQPVGVGELLGVHEIDIH